MRDESRRAAELFGFGVVIGLAEITFLSLGRGAVVYFMGSVFVTGILWTMLALRTMADSGPVDPEIDDGLISVAVTAWVMVVVPPRFENFIEEHALDDLARLYVPVSLVAVFAVLAAQKLWPRREVKFIVVRWLISTAMTLVVTAGLLWFVAKGDDAGVYALRSLGVAAVSTVAGLVLGRK